MQTSLVNAPFPDLRIIATQQLRPHEAHDARRSDPLITSLQQDEYLSNPPIVTPAHAGSDDSEAPYVVLDGANRSFAFETLGYPHILVQVVAYNHYLSLDVWSYVISELPVAELIDHLDRLPAVHVAESIEGDEYEPEGLLAQLLTADDKRYAISTIGDDLRSHNASLVEVVSLCQRSAVLNRTTVRQPQEVLPLFPHASALMIFPLFEPEDILMAARERAYLPPGISRHVVQGRAVKVNFPLEILRDDKTALEAKNETLRQWIQGKMANRQVRYYAEATYHFNE